MTGLVVMFIPRFIQYGCLDDHDAVRDLNDEDDDGEELYGNQLEKCVIFSRVLSYFSFLFFSDYAPNVDRYSDTGSTMNWSVTPSTPRIYSTWLH